MRGDPSRPKGTNQYGPPRTEPHAPNCVCNYCGKGFYTDPSQIRLRNGGQHCSRACLHANNDARRRAEAHPAWGGNGVLPQSARGRARKLYPLDGPCQRCEKADAVDRHHVDGNPWNNEPDNVQALCRRCHMELDGRLDQLLAIRRAQYILTAEQAARIRERYVALRAGRSRCPAGSVAALAEEFGISEQQVGQIGRGVRWAA